MDLCVCQCDRDGTGIRKISSDTALSVIYDGEKVTMTLKADGEEVILEP